MSQANFDIKIDNLQKASTKNKVDIVFVVDISGSMEPVIEGVKENINKFVNSLKDNVNNPIDYRLGLVLENCETFYIKDFTTSIDEFKNALNQFSATEYDEFTLPAIDMAADFPWDENRHKFIIIFTDEDVETGCNPEVQLEKYDMLIDKLNSLHIKLYYLGIHSDNYEKLKLVNDTYYEPHEDYNSVDFSELLIKVAKSVSQSSNTNLQKTKSSYPKDIYNVKKFVNIKKI